MKLFMKEIFVAFYKDENTFHTQKLVIKNDKIIHKEEFEFTQEELMNFINDCFMESTQTYVSTFIDTFNQGCVDSCSKTRYKELGINIDNLKILCLEDKYSIFVGLYELNLFQKEVERFRVDYIFSVFLLLDIHKTKQPNSIYVLFTSTFVAAVIYTDGIRPTYSNIYQFSTVSDDDEYMEDEDFDSDMSDIEFDEVDILDDIGDIGDIEEVDTQDLDSDIDEQAEANLEKLDNLDNIEELDDDQIANLQPEDDDIDDIANVKAEIEALDFIKNCIKEYYDDYADDFLQECNFFYTTKISKNFIKDIESETALDIKADDLDILDTINQLAMKEHNV
ncbi:MAG: hypothetical protein GXO40_01045 [Epsilonproteobacteria bacterium]|nr:hypothetical protein [Campylobacterota bacterium]